jgi:hypothetical protein
VSLEGERVLTSRLKVLLGGLPFLLLCLAALTGRAEGPPPKGKESKESKEEKKEGLLGGLPTPGGAVVAVVDSLAEALRKVPNSIVLDADRYRRMEEEIARLRAQLERTRPQAPCGCNTRWTPRPPTPSSSWAGRPAWHRGFPSTEWSPSSWADPG